MFTGLITMSIICQLCGAEFKLMVSGKHLKSHHQISSTEYKMQFGPLSLSTEEHRENARYRKSIVKKLAHFLNNTIFKEMAEVMLD